MLSMYMDNHEYTFIKFNEIPTSSENNRNISKEQECVPVGCVPPAAVAVPGGRGVPPGIPPPETRPPSPETRHPSPPQDQTRLPRDQTPPETRPPRDQAPLPPGPGTPPPGGQKPAPNFVYGC